jgi:hypothetical protein
MTLAALKESFAALWRSDQPRAPFRALPALTEVANNDFDPPAHSPGLFARLTPEQQRAAFGSDEPVASGDRELPAIRR